MPAISILTRMLPVPIIDGRVTHTFMSMRDRTSDETEAGMSIPRGLDGIGDGCGVRTVEFGLHTRACVGSAHVTQNHDQGGAYPRIQRKGTSVPLASTWGGALKGF